MEKIALESLNEVARNQMLRARNEPVLVTEGDRPILVVRDLLEDDTADELIAQHPEFQASVERARNQKLTGQVKSLAEMRAKYANE